MSCIAGSRRAAKLRCRGSLHVRVEGGQAIDGRRITADLRAIRPEYSVCHHEVAGPQNGVEPSGNAGAQEQRDVKLAEQLRDGFAQLALPQAALRLKQGFGRLIRRSTDRGAVVILDNRILGRDYGKAFLDVLPPASRAP